MSNIFTPFEECTSFVAGISYGKDSLAMLEVIRQLGLPLTNIVTVDVMATPCMSANYDCVEDFKRKVDQFILERYGIEVEHLKAERSYEEHFYRVRGSRSKAENVGKIYGFPMLRGAWCNSRLKVEPINKYKGYNQWWYIGYAVDEKKRERQLKISSCSDLRMYPLVYANKTEEWCRELCSTLGILSPIYNGSCRDGCWFCHNQPLEQLRKLYHEYPLYWKKLLEWDKDSPVPFKPNCTVRELDIRFSLEDEYLWNGLSIRSKSFFKDLRKRVALLDNGDITSSHE